jgi:hypothetical protein
MCDGQIAIGHITIDIFWFAWSLMVVIETADYSSEQSYVKADCEIPAGTIFYCTNPIVHPQSPHTHPPPPTYTLTTAALESD